MNKKTRSSVLLSAVLIAAPAFAEEPYNAAVFTGFDVNEGGWGTYIGTVYALNGDLGTSGWTATAILGYSEFADSSVLPSSSSKTLTGSALLGYLWHSPNFYTTLSFGVDIIDNTESPWTGSPTAGTKVGAVAQVGFETTENNTFYFNGFGTFMTANERVYSQLRAGYRGSQHAYGLEGVYSDERGSKETTKMGLFLSGIPVGKSELGISAGYFDERGTSASDGMYMAVEFSVPVRF